MTSQHRLGPLEPVAAPGRTLACLTTYLRFHIQLSNRKLQMTTVFSLRLFFLLILFMHLCKDCQDGFSAITPKGLKLHQKKCQSFLKHEAGANERRKATAASKNVRRTKLKERKVRLSSAALGVRFFQQSIIVIVNWSIRKAPLPEQAQVV
jgi:hypothetical protein